MWHKAGGRGRGRGQAQPVVPRQQRRQRRTRFTDSGSDDEGTLSSMSGLASHGAAAAAAKKKRTEGPYNEFDANAAVLLGSMIRSGGVTVGVAKQVDRRQGEMPPPRRPSLAAARQAEDKWLDEEKKADKQQKAVASSAAHASSAPQKPGAAVQSTAPALAAKSLQQLFASCGLPLDKQGPILAFLKARPITAASSSLFTSSP